MLQGRTILQIVPRLGAGGAERTTLEIAEAIVGQGGRALVATAGGALGAEIEAAGGELVVMPVHSKNPVTVYRNIGRLTRLIETRSVALVHARSRAPAWSALGAARKARVPLVTTHHGAYKNAGVFKRYYNSSILRGDIVIANSQFTANAIAATGAVPSERLRVIARGVDTARFSPGNVSDDRVRALETAWGTPPREHAFRVLLPARLSPWKGHETAIDALFALAPTGARPALSLVFCGGAHGRSSVERTLRDRVSASGMRDVIKIVGECGDMPAAYAWADLVLAPSTRPEAFGRVAIEAAAMEKPVIAADHGGARETVVEGDGRTGWRVAPGDAAALAGAISACRALTDDERQALGARARSRAERDFSADAMRAATLRVYQELLA